MPCTSVHTIVPSDSEWHDLKDAYSFSDSRRGAVVQPASGKTRITIRLDDDILDWFRSQVHSAGGGNYQTLINAALRMHIESQDSAGRDELEETLRRVIREEMPNYSVKVQE